MPSITLITSPVLLNLLNPEDYKLIRHVHPLGLVEYTVTYDTKEELFNLQRISAYPMEYAIQSTVLLYYNVSHLCRMIEAHIKLMLNVVVTTKLVKFTDPDVTYILPIYNKEYLYVTPNDAKLLDLDVLNLLGFVPVVENTLCWYHMRIIDPIYWNGICCIESKNLSKDTLEEQFLTEMMLENTMRKLKDL